MRQRRRRGLSAQGTAAPARRPRPRWPQPGRSIPCPTGPSQNSNKKCSIESGAAWHDIARGQRGELHDRVLHPHRQLRSSRAYHFKSGRLRWHGGRGALLDQDRALPALMAAPDGPLPVRWRRRLLLLVWRNQEVCSTAPHAGGGGCRVGVGGQRRRVRGRPR